MAELALVKHRLPPAWDGRRVTWDAFEEQPPMFLCPPSKGERCDCGDIRPPLVATGLRHPLPGEQMESTRRKIGRWGRWVNLPAMVPAWPLRDIYAARCQGCGETTVWDMRTDEWWTLDDSDYGPEGSVRPPEWAGGLFDLLTPTDPEGTK